MDAILGLGANLGSREAALRAAIALLGLDVVATSRLYETAPLGPPQPRFLNAAVRVRTELGPRALLSRAQAVEAQLGRVRRERWGPRTLDIDILWWEGGAVDEPGLTIPHPGLFERAFALAPLLDVAPELDDGRLATLDPVAARGWTEIGCFQDRVQVCALDDADALALALGAALGEAGAPTAVEVIEAESPAELVARATERAGSARARLVLETLGPRLIRARLMLDPREKRPLRALALRDVSGATCTIALDPRPNLL